jgi:apolipoprotein N-acyltransferase
MSSSKIVPWLLAVLTGLLLGVSQPIVIESIGDSPIDPTGLTGCLALVGLVPLLLALRGTGPKRAYQLAFVALFVQFTINVQWLVVAMVVFGRIPLLASWAILSLLTAAMAAYVAAAAAVSRMLVGRFHWPMWLVFPAALCAAETLRNFGPLGGFPWGNIGTSFATVPLLLQPAALFGVHGLVLLAALVSSSIAEVIATRNKRALAVAVGVVVAWVGFGAARLAGDSTDGATVKVALLQGDIEQGIRNDLPWTGRRILDRYHTEQDEAVAKGAQIVVWPEAAFPLRLGRDLKSLDGQHYVEDGATPAAAVIGAVGYESKRVDGHREDVHSNSAFILQGQNVVGRVDKTHLVPFGEYVPWPLGAIVRQIVPIGGMEPGAHYEGIPVQVTASDGVVHEVKLGTTICYEGIFPEIARRLRRAGAQLHVNITNDGWYGISGAPTQHLDFYALRAVESGMPVIRAANTGRSAWIDTRGRIHDATDIYVDKAVIADVPLATSDTLYVMFGEWLSLPITAFILGAWFWSMLGADVLRRKRATLDTMLGVVGIATAVVGTVAYLAFMDHAEDTATRVLVLVLVGLIAGVGALSARPWARRAHLVVGIVLVVVGLAAAAIGGVPYALFAIAGALLAANGVKRKDAFARAVDPLVLDGR